MPNKFVFPLAALRKYREHQRDLCRQLLADALGEDAALVRQRDGFETIRSIQIDEMRQLTERAVDVDGSAARRYHASQMTVEIRMVEEQRNHVARKIAECRYNLIQADQKVKALEKLEAKQYAEHVQEQERRTARDLEETWMATKLQEAHET